MPVTEKPKLLRPMWWPRALPEVYDYPVLCLDTETTGLKMFDDVPVGLAITGCKADLTPVRSWYLAWGHPSKNNTTLDEVREWAEKELTNPAQPKWFHYARFDLHQLANVRIPLAGPVRCSMVLASLVRGYRYVRGESLELKELAARWCQIPATEQRDLGRWMMQRELVPGRDIAKAPGRVVGAYAVGDTERCAAIARYALQMVEQAELAKAWDIEARLTYPLWLMERRGVRFDYEQCEKWLQQVQRAYTTGVSRLRFRLSAPRFNPSSAQQLGRLWELHGAGEEVHHTQPSDRFPDGQASFTTDLLEHHYSQSRKPELADLAKEVLRIRKINDLATRYLRRYLDQDAVWSRDHFRIHAVINQLPADTPGTDDHFGAVTGRTSMTDPNLQQVMHPEKQEKYGTSVWGIRKLFLPEPGQRWNRRDYSQLEFRWFAHYTGDPDLIGIYQRDPDADFHQIVADIVHLTRKPGKTINFALLYGMGLAKTATRLGMTLDEATKVVDKYNTLFPSAHLLKIHVERTVRRRLSQNSAGWVCTVLGRRRYFREGDSLNPALNAVMQGSAADTIKVAQVLLYERHGLVPLLQVHDELNDSIPEHDVNRVDGIYDDTMIEAGRILGCRVPLLTAGKAAGNWGDAT